MPNHLEGLISGAFQLSTYETLKMFTLRTFRVFIHGIFKGSHESAENEIFSLKNQIITEKQVCHLNFARTPRWSS